MLLSESVLKTNYGTDKSRLEKNTRDSDKNMSDISGLVKETDWNAKIKVTEGKIPTITSLVAATAALTAVKNAIPNTNNLAKKRIMKQKYQTLKINTLLQSIRINLQLRHVVQK